MTVDIGQLAPNLEPEFTQWRTGEGGAAEWTLVADASAKGGRAIAQVSNDKTSYRFPLAIYKPFSGKDLEVLVRFKPVTGTVDQAGGIAVRVVTPDDYYVLRANALEDNVRFYRVVKGGAIGRGRRQGRPQCVAYARAEGRRRPLQHLL